MSDETTLRDTENVPQVLIILQDNLSTGELDVGGVQRPSEFNAKSPAHVVGKFIAENLDQIIIAAQHAAAGLDRPDVGESIIGPDRERTIILPPGAGA